MTLFKATVSAFALGVMWVAGGVSAGASDKPVIGIAMPNTAETRWIADGANIVRSLQERGYGSDLRNADNDVVAQISQIESMVANGDQILLIAPIDGFVLGDVLKHAAARGIKVIAYDRLIRGTPNVDYYASFQNVEVGVLQAQSLLRGLGIPPAAGPFNIELFGGSPDDGNAYPFYNGAMSILKPFIDSGKLVVQSRQTAMEDISTPRWNPNVAHARLDNLLAAFYAGRHLDAVLSPNDEISSGILASLESAGYGRGDTRMAVVTGQDCEIPAVKAIIAGEQYSSVFKDTRKLAEVAVDMVAAMLTGTPVPVNDPTGYDNGVKRVPAYLLTPVVVYKDSIEDLLIRSGYYTRSQID